MEFFEYTEDFEYTTYFNMQIIHFGLSLLEDIAVCIGIGIIMISLFFANLMIDYEYFYQYLFVIPTVSIETVSLGVSMVSSVFIAYFAYLIYLEVDECLYKVEKEEKKLLQELSETIKPSIKQL